MKTLIKNATIVNDGKKFCGHIVINGEYIESVTTELPQTGDDTHIINAQGKLAIPGVIDEHVHFREPGLTHKADIESESKAAVAGGVTSFMDMPNVNPQTITNDLLRQKMEIASEKSLANYAFYLGATNDNLPEIIKADISSIAGIKLFMGSSTGNMLVDKGNSLESIFAESPCLIMVHCEDEQTIKENIARFKELYGDNVLPTHHPLIRTADACYKSTAKAVELAQKYGSQLHIAHLSTKDELSLLESRPLKDKKITAETCPQYLFFDQSDYEKFGYRIKCNPAIKSAEDRKSLISALSTNKIDTIATDHAPHLKIEKFGDTYFCSASGMPTIQYSLLAMLDLYNQGQVSIETIVEKMCHAPANIYNIEKRGYLKAGFKADFAIIDTNKPQTVSEDKILSKCKWSPFEKHTFGSTVTHTFVNGNLVYCDGQIDDSTKGQPLLFCR